MKKDRSTQAISKESAFIVSDMLKESVKNGTAKKLSYLNLPICAKTGTVGTYKGNSDAYTLSYTKDYVVSVWLGATEGAMMSNSVSGGALPAAISAEIWREMSGLGHVFREILPPEGVKKINLDRKIYEEDKKEAEIPAEYEGIPSISAYYKNSRIPTLKSSPFLGITAEFSSVSASYNSICILLCVPEYMEFDLYREELSSKQQTFLCTIAQSKQYSYSDSEVLPGKKYVYHLIPKFRAKNGEYRYGNPVLSDTIITPLPF